MVRSECPGERSALLPKSPGIQHDSLPGSHAPRNAVQLKKKLGLANGVSLIAGTIIGAGIFVSPAGVMRYAGSVGMSLVVWALSGTACFIGALCYAELGTMIPMSGGDYAYILAAFGPFAAFLQLWTMLVIVQPAGNAIVALTFANYVLRPFFNDVDCIPPPLALRLIAALVICKHGEFSLNGYVVTRCMTFFCSSIAELWITLVLLLECLTFVIRLTAAQTESCQVSW